MCNLFPRSFHPLMCKPYKTSDSWSDSWKVCQLGMTNSELSRVAGQRERRLWIRASYNHVLSLLCKFWIMKYLFNLCITLSHTGFQVFQILVIWLSCNCENCFQDFDANSRFTIDPHYRPKNSSQSMWPFLSLSKAENNLSARTPSKGK